ncbi:hypothetical protein CISG_07284 [Coccidioides immitis RMSCC 3703]|uniref:DASH complex subunit SPC19 n=1 Tax=Coccidioides immitis RMSCC 3703 TaxID=454286 RepID=A0A0J8R5Y6_COCIT|nr:hypothetical protein CISG_07284 [Coccidioides immitis RMSCC 3703]
MAASLSSSVASLKSSLQLLESSIDVLDNGVNDFPRLCKILQSTRHFELLPEPTLQEAQKAILDEITPSIAHLLRLSGNHIDKLARREEALKAKCELQEGRLSRDSRPSSRVGGHADGKTEPSGLRQNGRKVVVFSNSVSEAAKCNLNLLYMELCAGSMQPNSMPIHGQGQSGKLQTLQDDSFDWNIPAHLSSLDWRIVPSIPMLTKMTK